MNVYGRIQVRKSSMDLAVDFKLLLWFSHTILCQVWCLLSFMVSLFTCSERNWFCHSYKFLLFYTLASLESTIANIYFCAIYAIWSSVSLPLLQSVCCDCLGFLCQLLWLFLGLPVFTLLPSYLSHDYYSCS